MPYFISSSTNLILHFRLGSISDRDIVPLLYQSSVVSYQKANVWCFATVNHVVSALHCFDSGQIWHGLRRHFLEAGPIFVHIGGAKMQLIRILSTPSTDPSGWVRSTDWSTLVRLPPKRFITFHFASPTAFNMGNRHFELLPEPTFVWESLLRVWNTYAPACFQVEKQALRESVERQIDVVKSDLHTETLLFSEYTQKGFLGTCQYVIHNHDESCPQLTTLAAFAYYAGIGYKTTMGMGQVQVQFDDALAKP
jgi:CRISPR-associated endoribonuclease Cas6